MRSGCRNSEKPRTVDPTILSPGMVTVIPGPETLPSLTLEFPSPQVLSPVGPRKLTLPGMGWCSCEEGRLVPALPKSISLSGPLHKFILKQLYPGLGQ